MNRFSMLDLSDSEGEEAAAPVAAPAPVKKTNNNKATKARKPAAKAAPVAASNPVDAKKENTKKSAKSYDRHAPTRQREFDRHSGTGRDKSIKKDGAGGRNWGKAGEGSEMVGAPTEDAAPAEEAEPVVEEPDNSMTMEEYTASLKKPTGANFKPLAVRKVTNTFGKQAPLNKSLNGVPATDVELKSKRERDRNTKEKRTVEIGFTPPPLGGQRQERPARDQGAPRGGFRGGRGRGGFRGGRGGSGAPRSNTRVPNVMDQKAFPSL